MTFRREKWLPLELFNFFCVGKIILAIGWQQHYSYSFVVIERDMGKSHGLMAAFNNILMR